MNSDALYRRLRTTPRQRLEFGRLCGRDAPLGAGYERAGQGMLGVGLYPSGEGEQLRLFHAANRDDVGEPADHGSKCRSCRR